MSIVLLQQISDRFGITLRSFRVVIGRQFDWPKVGEVKGADRKPRSPRTRIVSGPRQVDDLGVGGDPRGIACALSA